MLVPQSGIILRAGASKAEKDAVALKYSVPLGDPNKANCNNFVVRTKRNLETKAQQSLPKKRNITSIFADDDCKPTPKMIHITEPDSDHINLTKPSKDQRTSPCANSTLPIPGDSKATAQLPDVDVSQSRRHRNCSPPPSSSSSLETPVHSAVPQEKREPVKRRPGRPPKCSVEGPPPEKCKAKRLPGRKYLEKSSSETCKPFKRSPGRPRKDSLEMPPSSQAQRNRAPSQFKKRRRFSDTSDDDDSDFNTLTGVKRVRSSSSLAPKMLKARQGISPQRCKLKRAAKSNKYRDVEDIEDKPAQEQLKRRGRKSTASHSADGPIGSHGQKLPKLAIEAVNKRKLHKRKELPSHLFRKVSGEELSRLRIAFVKYYPTPPSNLQAHSHFEQLYDVTLTPKMIAGLWDNELKPWSERWWRFYTMFNEYAREQKKLKPSDRDPTIKDSDALKWASDFHKEHGDARVPTLLIKSRPDISDKNDECRSLEHLHENAEQNRNNENAGSLQVSLDIRKGHENRIGNNQSVELEENDEDFIESNVEENRDSPRKSSDEVQITPRKRRTSDRLSRLNSQRNKS